MPPTRPPLHPDAKPSALIASAVRIRLSQKPQPRKTEQWQSEAWTGYENVGEAQHGIDYIANLISKVRLYGAVLPDDPRDPPIKDTDPRSEDAILSLKTRGGDYSAVLRELVINLYVAGEALDVDTLVATPTGFKKMGDLQRGDIILGGGGRPCKVLVAHEVQHDRPCYEVRLSGDIRIVADANHLWEAQNNLGRVKQTYREKARLDSSVPREPIIHEDVTPQVVTTERMFETLKYRGKYASNWSIRIDSVKGERKDLPIDPYILGYWLGDGTSTQGAVTVHHDDQPNLRERVEAAGYTWSPRSGDRRGFQIGILGLQKQLRLAGLLGNKHIPDEYLRASEQQRWALLQGLMDSDGHIDKKGTCEFANFNPRLLWDVVELTASLGLKPGRPSARRFCFKSAGQPVATLSRKAERITARRGEDEWRYVQDIQQVKSRPVRCITVDSPDQTFMVTERFVRTHNCYLVGRGNAENEVDNWEIYSTEELQITDKFLIREAPSSAFVEYTDSALIVIRIYFPHPRWGQLPISPLRGVLASLEEIQRIERVIRGAATSRSAGPGLLLVPDEASFADPAPETASEEEEGNQGDPFVRKLINAMVTPIQDEGSASAAVPIVVRAPADVLKEFRKLDLSIAVDAELIKLERAITRLAQGLPLPPEVVTGKAGINHWTAFQISEETITAYVAPVLHPILSALTVEWYRPLLVALGMSETEARTRVLAGDVNELITRPNRSADADFGLEHMAISDDEWRKVKGFTGESAPSDLAKLARLMLQRGSFDPSTTAALMKAAGIIPKNLELPIETQQQPPTPQPSPGQQQEDRNPPADARPSSSPPSQGRQRSALMFLPPSTPDEEQVSHQLTEIDRDLRLRLQSTAEAAVTRALERAGASVIQKLGKRSRYQTLMRDVPKLEVGERVGRIAAESEGVDVASLFSTAYDPFIAKFKDWTARAYSRAARVLDLNILTPTDLITSAADQLAADLIAFSTHRLFHSSSSDNYGEGDADTLLPHSIVRKALYRAGGGTSLLPDNSSPPGGVATGTTVMTALLDAGGKVEGWEWVYASTMRTRDFEPHAVLDGTRFTNFSNPALRNPGTWPPVTMLYPGDHDHCSCAVRPLLRLPAQEASA